MFGKMILPMFGGSPAVWLTALVFFQLMLLPGYAHVYATTTWLGIRKQAALHLLILGVAIGGAACAGVDRMDSHISGASAGLSLLDADNFDWATVLCVVGQCAAAAALVCYYERSRSRRSIFSVRSE
jgi:hypothetical protein